MKSTPQVRTDLFGRKLSQVLLTDFFGSVRNIELLNETSLGDTQTPERGWSVEEEEERDSKRETGPAGFYLTAQDSLVSH